MCRKKKQAHEIFIDNHTRSIYIRSRDDARTTPKGLRRKRLQNSKRGRYGLARRPLDGVAVVHRQNCRPGHRRACPGEYSEPFAIFREGCAAGVQVNTVGCALGLSLDDAPFLHSESVKVYCCSRKAPRSQRRPAHASADLSRTTNSASPSIRERRSQAFAKAARSQFGLSVRTAPASQNFRSASASPEATRTCCRVGGGAATRDAGVVRTTGGAR